MCLILLALFSALPSAHERAIEGWETGKIQYLNVLSGRLAYGLYIKNHKVGWYIETFQIENRYGQTVCLCHEEFSMRTRFAGETSQFFALSETLYDLNDGTILSAEESSTSNGVETTIDVIRDGEEMVISHRSHQGLSTRRVAMPKHSLQEGFRFWLWLQGRRMDGDTFRYHEVDWQAHDVNRAHDRVFQSRKRIPSGGTLIEVFEIRGSLYGMPCKETVSASGRLVKGFIGPIEVRPEDASSVRKMDDRPGAGAE
jgi:hypothetical protein